MRDWSKANRHWQCITCLDLIPYDEICQPAGSSSILCPECFDMQRTIGMYMAVPPMLCDSCGAGMLPLEHVAQNNVLAVASERYCRACSDAVNETDVDGAIDALLGILKDNDEEG
jgi:hypothetical protein